jgi:hypothetical protein
MGKAEKFPAEEGITQCRAHHYAPKEKPHTGRFICSFGPFDERKDLQCPNGHGVIETFQKECLDYHYEPMPPCADVRAR